MKILSIRKHRPSIQVTVSNKTMKPTDYVIRTYRNSKFSPRPDGYTSLWVDPAVCFDHPVVVKRKQVK